MEMKNYLIGILCILFLASCGKRIGSGAAVFADEQKTMMADSLVFSEKEYDDSHWPIWGRVNGDSVFWVRSASIMPKFDPGEPVGLRVVGTGAFEIYWDGIYLGNNGTLANGKNMEVPGKYVNNILLADSLAQPGEHVLALRCTMKDEHVTQHLFYSVSNYLEIVTGPLQMSKFMFFIAGVFAMAAFYFFILYIGERTDFSLLVFSTICFVFLTLLLLEYCKLFYFYEYTFQRPRLISIGYMYVALSILIPLFFALEFKFPRIRWLAVFLLLSVVFIQVVNHEQYDTAAVIQNRFMWFTSLAIVIWACVKKYREAYIVLLGFFGSYMVFYFTPYFELNYVSNNDVAIFVSFVCIILTMLYIMGSRRKEQRIAYQESLVTSERLKNELLKKNIKPHFIMNTLTSLIDWVEESPKEGVKFIHALADEFDILNDIADHKLVPIEQEIKLCENHLKVMSFRKEVNYRWVQDGIDNNEIIPPAILHTIVENGVTHSKPNSAGEIVFMLNYRKEKGYKEYQLLVKSNIDEKVNADTKENKVVGTGTKYIKSRLTESYGSKWNYHSEAVEEGWLTSIKIFQ